MATGAQLFHSRKARERREELERQRRNKLERGKRVSRGERRAKIESVRAKQEAQGVKPQAPTVSVAQSRIVQRPEQTTTQTVQTQQAPQQQSTAREQLQTTKTPIGQQPVKQGVQTSTFQARKTSLFGNIKSYFFGTRDTQQIEQTGRFGRDVRTQTTIAGEEGAFAAAGRGAFDVVRMPFQFALNVGKKEGEPVISQLEKGAAIIEQQGGSETRIGRAGLTTIKSVRPVAKATAAVAEETINDPTTYATAGLGGVAFKGASIVARGGVRVLQAAKLTKTANVVDKGFAVGSAGLLGAAVVEGGVTIANAEGTEAKTASVLRQARGFAAFGAGFKVAGKAANVVERGAFGAFGEFVPAGKVFSPKVLSGEAKFPTAKSPQESFKLFQESRSPTGKIEVITATGENFGRTTTILKGGQPTKSGKITEDVGLFVAPIRTKTGEGLGSARFLRIGATPKASEALAQTKSISDLKSKFSFGAQPLDTPAGIRFQLDQFVPAPRRVVSAVKQKGFGETVAFQEGLQGKNVGYQTVRSTLKQTSEIEGNIAFGTQVRSTETSLFGRIAGSKQFTVVKGKVVRLPQFEIVKGQSSARTVIGGSRVSSKAPVLEPTTTAGKAVSSFSGSSKVQLKPYSSSSGSSGRSSIGSTTSTFSSVASGSRIAPSQASLSPSKTSAAPSSIARRGSSRVGSSGSSVSKISGGGSSFSGGSGASSGLVASSTAKSRLFKLSSNKRVQPQQVTQFGNVRKLEDTPTAFAAGFNVFGKRTIGGSKSGLGGRFLKATPPKKKRRGIFSL